MNIPQSTALPDVRTAVQRSVSLLERATSQFFGRAACFACHEQPAARAFAVGATRAKGIAIDEKAAGERWTQLTSGLNATQLEGAAPLGGADNNLYLAEALFRSGYAPDRKRDILAANLAAYQGGDGGWHLPGYARSPLQNDDGNVVTCNSAGLKIMKVQPQDVLGRTAADVFSGANKWIVEKIELVDKKQSQDVTMDAEMMFGGEKVSANVTVLPLVSTQKKRLGSLVMIEDISSEKRVKATMARYMDPSVAEKALQVGAEILGGHSSIASVLFSDIRSFTTLTEELGPQATVSLLNEYFTIMVDCIQYEGGMLDKFIGDAIMAVFGTPMPHEDDEDRAVRAALHMLQELHAYNIRREPEGKRPIDIGINTDTIVSGNIGSPRRMDYTVIGDGVNLTSRLEGACKQYHAHLLVSEYTIKKLRGTYRSREIDRVVVRGKTQPVGLFEVLDYHTDETFPNCMEVLNNFRYGLNIYRERRWSEGIKSFKDALALNPQDYVSQMYIDRCEHLKNSPPPEDWNGVWVLTSK